MTRDSANAVMRGDDGDEFGEGLGVVLGSAALASAPCGVGGLPPGGQVGDGFAARAQFDAAVVGGVRSVYTGAEWSWRRAHALRGRHLAKELYCSPGLSLIVAMMSALAERLSRTGRWASGSRLFG